jgi:HSP20 family protein
MELNSINNTSFHSYIRTLYGNFCDLEFISNADMGKEEISIHAPTNVLETDESYNIQIALPGYKKENISARIDEDVLTIQAQCHEEKKENIKRFYKKEFFTSSFRRSFLLPGDVQDDAIEGIYRDGVLLLMLPKTENPIKCTKDIQIRS